MSRSVKIIDVIFILLWVVIIAVTFLAFNALKSGYLDSSPICSTEEFGENSRVVIHNEDNGQMICLRGDETTPDGYKEFPGGAPTKRNDRRWVQYLNDHPYAPPNQAATSN